MVVWWAVYPDKEGHRNTRELPRAVHAQTRQAYNLSRPGGRFLANQGETMRNSELVT